MACEKKTPMNGVEKILFERPPLGKDRELDTNTDMMFDILTSKTTGLDFSNDMEFSREFWNYNYRYIGAGLAVGDVNNDGLPDVYFCSNEGEDKLFLNKGGLEFEDITQEANIVDTKGSWSTGVTMVDVNNDGLLDIYVAKSWNVEKPALRKNKCYINQGNLKFKEQAEKIGLDDDGFSIHASFFDADKDGDLDVYVVNHPVDFNDRNKLNNHEKIEQGNNKSDQLYRNDGKGVFTNVSKEAGINNHGFGLSVTTFDLNGDGWTDIFVANDWGMQDHLYINQKDGTFKDESLERFPKQSFSSMGVDINDLNNDGAWDVFVTEMEYGDHVTHKSFSHDAPMLAQYRKMVQGNYHHQYYRNALHINNGDGTFIECARMANTASTDWSWGTLMIDVDNDGWKDLFVANGYFLRFDRGQRVITQKIKNNLRRGNLEGVNDLIGELNLINFESPNKLFLNNRDLTFDDVSEKAGLNSSAVSHGASYADFDLDGDLDIIVNNTNNSPFLYRNNSAGKKENNFLRLKLIGTEQNKDAIGSEIEIKTKNGFQKQHLISTKSYQSSSEFIIHFGLGEEKIMDEIKIKWPDGTIQFLKNVKANQVLEVKKKGVVLKEKKNQKKNKLFEKLEENHAFEHQENKFDDFKRNQLKPRFHSKNGPSIALGDLDGDGQDDFYISGATGQKGKWFKKTNNGFESQGEIIQNKEIEELGTLIFDADNDGDNDIYITAGNIEKNTVGDQIYLNDGKGGFSQAKNMLPEINTLSACVTASDFDQDGDLDLFIGGRYQRNHYPQPGKSYLLENKEGRFEDVTEEKGKELSNIGMVTSALWSDYDNDGWQDLILVGEWMPITIFKNKNGVLKQIENIPSLGKTTGWWNSIVAHDFDKDGDTDYVLGNQGLNMRYRPKKNEPIEIYYGDFDREKGTDFILSYTYKEKKYPIHFLQDLAKEYSFVAERFKSYNEYAKTTTQEILGNKNWEKAQEIKAHTFAHVYMENKGNGKMELKELPMATQVSNINGMLVDDFNMDGNSDILLHGNSLDWLPQYEKQDGLTGLLLKGDGNGSFEAENYVQTGFESKGEGRALSQWIGEEGKYILAGICDDEMKIFSQEKNPTKNIKLKKDDCQIIIEYKDGKKEKREVYYGEGYLSQNSRWITFNPKEIKAITIWNYQRGKRELLFGK